MNMHPKFQFRHLPWVTLALFGMLWAIHLFIRWSGDPAAVREAFGIDFANPMTYITHAFIHDGMSHIRDNTIALLFLGSVAEAQVGRRWYCGIVVLGILAGPVGALLFHQVAEAHIDERLVGFSAATSALFIVAVGAFAGHWGWGRSLSMITLGFLIAVLISALAELWHEGPGNVAHLSIAFSVSLCTGVNWYCWHRRDGRPHRLTPLLCVVILLMADLVVGEWTYSSSGHGAGSIAGAALTFAALRGESPTAATGWLKGRVHYLWFSTREQLSWTSKRVRRIAETKWFAPGLLALSLVSLVIVLRATEFRSTNPLVQFLVGG